jgi:pilus assembly protein Flp/PilA
MVITIYFKGGRNMERFKRFIKDEEGVTAIEYALIASLIAVAIIGAVTLVGSDLSAKFTSIAGSLKGGN